MSESDLLHRKRELQNLVPKLGASVAEIYICGSDLGTGQWTLRRVSER